MAGPTTAVLNDDLKELKADLKEMRGDIKALVASVGRLETKMDQRSLFGSWVATALAPALLALFGTVVAGAWYAGSRFATLDAKVGQINHPSKAEVSKR